MEKERESRPPSAVELRASIEQCLEQLSPSLTPPSTGHDQRGFAIDSPSGSPEKKAPKERYNLLKRLDETPQGERFLALDEQTGKGVEVFAFNHNALANAELVAALKTELETIRNASLPLLRAVFAFEQFREGARLIQESFVGLPLLAILRVRKELSSAEIDLLLSRLAPLADFAQRYALKQVDLTLTGIWVGSSQGSTPHPEHPLQSWHPLEIKVDPIDVSSAPTPSRHSQSEVTAINPTAVGGARVAGSSTAPLLQNNQCRMNQAAGIYFIHDAKGRAEGNICDGNAWCGIMVVASGPYLSENELLRNLQCGLAYDSESKLSLGKRNVFSENKQGDLLTKPVIQHRR